MVLKLRRFHAKNNIIVRRSLIMYLLNARLHHKARTFLPMGITSGRQRATTLTRGPTRILEHKRNAKRWQSSCTFVDIHVYIFLINPHTHTLHQAEYMQIRPYCIVNRVFFPSVSPPLSHIHTLFLHSVSLSFPFFTSLDFFFSTIFSLLNPG